LLELLADKEDGYVIAYRSVVPRLSTPSLKPIVPHLPKPKPKPKMAVGVMGFDVRPGDPDPIIPNPGSTGSLDMCWTCWNGATRDWKSDVNNMIDWLDENPDYTLNVNSSAGAWSDPTWTPDEVSEINSNFERLVGALNTQSKGKYGAKDVELNRNPSAVGKNLSFDPAKR